MSIRSSRERAGEVDETWESCVSYPSWAILTRKDNPGQQPDTRRVSNADFQAGKKQTTLRLTSKSYARPEIRSISVPAGCFRHASGRVRRELRQGAAGGWTSVLELSK